MTSRVVIRGGGLRGPQGIAGEDGVQGPPGDGADITAAEIYEARDIAAGYAAAADGSAAAASASAIAAIAVGTTNDTVIASRVSDSTSATRTALATSLPEVSTMLSTTRAAKAAGQRLLLAWKAQQRQATRVAIGAIVPGTGVYAGAPSALETTVATGASYVNSTRTWTNTAGAHGLAVGDRVRFLTTGRTGISFLGGAAYGYVLSVPSSTTWTMTQTVGGTTSPDLGTDGSVTAWYKNWPTTYSAWVPGIQTVTITASSDLWTTPLPHYLAVGDSVRVTASTATGVVNNTTYYVRTTPTTTTFTVSAVVSGTTLDVTTDGTAALGQANPALLWSDYRAVQRTSASPGDQFTQGDTTVIHVGAGVGGNGPLSHTEIVDRDRFEIAFFNDGALPHEVIVDGVSIDLVTPALLTAAGVTSGNTGSKAYTFPDFRSRTVTVRSAGALTGIRVPAASTVSRPVVVNPGPTVFATGDSFYEGAGSATGVRNGLIAVTKKLLRWANFIQAGDGGTGYTQPGTKLALIDRYQADVIDQPHDVTLYGHGLNDERDTLAKRNACVAAALTIWNAERTQYPDREQVIQGPFSPKGIGADNGVDYRDPNLVLLDLALQAAALSTGRRYISPIQEGWITGNGKVGATTGHGNSDTFISSDGTHPTDDGHEYLGSRLAGHLHVMFA